MEKEREVIKVEIPFSVGEGVVSRVTQRLSEEGLDLEYDGGCLFATSNPRETLEERISKMAERDPSMAAEFASRIISRLVCDLWKLDNVEDGVPFVYNVGI